MSDSLLMLLEMIEEVLEERSQSAQQLSAEYSKLHEEILKMLTEEEGIEAVPIREKNNQGVELPHRVTYKLKSFANRADLAEKIKQSLKLPNTALPVYDSSGNQIIGYKIKSGRSIVFNFVLKPQRGFNIAEQMESVIARATGNADAEFKKVPVLQNQLLRMELDAEQILGKPLTKLKNQKLPQDGIYKRYGATSGVPKTDLIGIDGEARYSVKKSGGSQFVSAQGPESAALWHIAAKNSAANPYEKAVDEALKNIPELIKQQFSYEQFQNIKSFTQKEKAEIFSEVGNTLFKKIIEGMNIDPEKFKEAFAVEGMTGREKFNNGKGTANLLLTWNETGSPAIEPIQTIEKFVKLNKDKIKLRVSDRGGKRGGSIRGDIKDQSTMNESIVIEVIEDEAQEAKNEVEKFIKSNNITPEEMKKIIQKAGVVIKEQVANQGAQLAVRNPDLLDKVTEQAVELLKRLGNTALDLMKKYAGLDKADQPSADTKSEKNYNQLVEGLTKQFRSLVYQKSDSGRFPMVRFLDYLIAPQAGGEINMIPFYEGLPVEFGDTEEPDEEIPMEET